MSVRVFAALGLPDSITEAACAEMKGVPGANWRPRENLHITLAFYGELLEPVVEELDCALGQIGLASFDLRLKGVGRFGGDRADTLWLGVEHSTALTELARQCRRAARQVGVELEKRAYRPHVTLAYLKKDAELSRIQRFEQRLGLFKTPVFTVDRFYLYGSWNRKPNTPNLYSIEAEYPLKGSI